MKKSSKRTKLGSVRKRPNPSKRKQKESVLVRSWRRRIEGALKFAEDLKRLGMFRSDAWARGNYRYYRDQVSELLDVKIPGIAKLKEEFSKRLRKLPPA